MPSGKWWINKDALMISLSAFFADMGYQAIVAGFPIFLVIVLKAPVYMLGIAYALTYGIGALFGYAGGVIGDKLGKKKTAIAGNIFILLLSSIGFATSALQSVFLYASGWWSRDFRSPPRRAMMSESTPESKRRQAFGTLHALDIGGGAIAIVYLLLLLYIKVSIRTIFLITSLPIVVSTLFLLFVRSRPAGRRVDRRSNAYKQPHKLLSDRKTLMGVLFATSLFGFSFYSLGFPILTITQQSHSSALGILAYGIFLLFSAAAGYMIGSKAKRMNMIKGLSILGYALAALGSLGLGLYYSMHLVTPFSYAAVAMLGIAVGSVETFEPTIISFISPRQDASRGMGYLTASRSIGLFIANAWMGILYAVSPAYSYYYAFLVSISAAIILLYMGRGFRR